MLRGRTKKTRKVKLRRLYYFGLILLLISNTFLIFAQIAPARATGSGSVYPAAGGTEGGTTVKITTGEDENLITNAKITKVFSDNNYVMLGGRVVHLEKLTARNNEEVVYSEEFLDFNRQEIKDITRGFEEEREDGVVLNINSLAYTADGKYFLVNELGNSIVDVSAQFGGEIVKQIMRDQYEERYIILTTNNQLLLVGSTSPGNISVENISDRFIGIAIDQITKKHLITTAGNVAKIGDPTWAGNFAGERITKVIDGIGDGGLNAYAISESGRVFAWCELDNGACNSNWSLGAGDNLTHTTPVEITDKFDGEIVEDIHYYNYKKYISEESDGKGIATTNGGKSYTLGSGNPTNVSANFGNEKIIRFYDNGTAITHSGIFMRDARITGVEDYNDYIGGVIGFVVTENKVYTEFIDNSYFDGSVVHRIVQASGQPNQFDVAGLQAVSVDGSDVTYSIADDGTTVYFKTPAHTVGCVPIELKYLDGSTRRLSDDFCYVDEPSLSKVEGSTDGGYEVIVRGKDFVGPTFSLPNEFDGLTHEGEAVMPCGYLFCTASGKIIMGDLNYSSTPYTLQYVEDVTDRVVAALNGEEINRWLGGGLIETKGGRIIVYDAFTDYAEDVTNDFEGRKVLTSWGVLASTDDGEVFGLTKPGTYNFEKITDQFSQTQGRLIYSDSGGNALLFSDGAAYSAEYDPQLDRTIYNFFDKLDLGDEELASAVMHKLLKSSF